MRNVLQVASEPVHEIRLSGFHHKEQVMVRQPVPRQATACVICQQQYQQLVDLYRMVVVAPGDPGARGLFDAVREDYESHHRQRHSEHAYQVTDEK